MGNALDRLRSLDTTEADQRMLTHRAVIPPASFRQNDVLAETLIRDLSEKGKRSARGQHAAAYQGKKEPFWYTDENTPDFDPATAWQRTRLTGVVRGAAASSASSITNAAGTLLDAIQNNNPEAIQRQAKVKAAEDNIARYQAQLLTAATDAERERLQGLIEQNRRAVQLTEQLGGQMTRYTQKGVDALQGLADDLAQTAAEETALAKEGLGAGGRFAVDVGQAALQMGGDALIGGGSALIPMAIRSFGGASQEARQAGAALDRQLAYGVGSAALSVATEKLSNVAAPFKAMFGKGVLDGALGRLTDRLGQSAAGRLALSAISEGGEEFIEDIFQPILQRATYDKDARFDLESALYDAAVGAVLGGVGGAADVALSGGSGGEETEIRRAPAAEAAREPFLQRDPVTQVLTDAAAGKDLNVNTQEAEAAAAERSGTADSMAGREKTAPQVGAEAQPDTPVHVGRVTTIQNPYQGVTPVQTQKPAAAVTVDESSVRTAENRIAGARELENSALRTSFKATLKNAYKAVFKAAKGVPVDGMTYEGKPYTVDINNTVPGKVINDPNLTAEKLALLDILPEVVRGGAYVGSGAYVRHSEKQKLTVRFDYFETPVEINDKLYIAAFDVEVFPNTNNYRTHKLHEIELSPITNADVGPAPTASVTETVPIEGTRPLNSDFTIPPGAETVNPSGDGLGAADAGFTTQGMEGTERTSRLADSMPYDQYQEAATAMNKQEYDKIFRYESQTEEKSMALAEELVYVIKDGRRTFLKDADENAFRALVQSLDEATAWNGPQTDAARMIHRELQGRSANMEIISEEYTDFLRSMQEHTTATGQGVQANAKWDRAGKDAGCSTELEALENLKQSNLSEQEQAEVFHRIVVWDSKIEAVQQGDTAGMKQLILGVAKERGTLNGLTGKQGRLLTALADKTLSSLHFDQLKSMAYASTSALSTDAAPADIGRKIKTIQVLNMLSSPKTAAKNLTGNTTFYGLDALAMRGAAILDMAISKKTGTRSVAFEQSALSKTARQAAVKALQLSAAEITLDVDMSGETSRYGLSSRRTFRANGNLADRILSALERNQAYLLNATDEFYKGAARATAEATQKLVDAGEIRTDNPRYAAEQAERLAQYRTFQDNSRLSAAISGLHDILNMVAGVGDSGKKFRGHTVHTFGAGDVVAPFTRVAGNLASRGLEYSPLNAAKGVVEILQEVKKVYSGQDVDAARQARGVSNTARGITGTAVAVGFMLLAKAGLLRQADDEGDDDVRALNQAEGVTGTQFNLDAAQRWLDGGDHRWQNGDTLIDLSSIEPLNVLMNLGTEMAKEDQSSIVTAFNATVDSFMSSTAELPVLQSIGNFGIDVFRYGQDPKEVFAREAANTITSSLTPNVMAAVARGIDDRPRSSYTGDTLTENIIDNVKSRIPKLRETLPGSVDNFGRDRTYQGSKMDVLLNAILNPVGVNHYTQGEVSQQLEQVRQETGEASFYPDKSAPAVIRGNGKETVLDYEQRQDFQRERGTTAYMTMAAMMTSQAFKAAAAEKKTELLDICNDYAYQTAKAGVLGDEAAEAWALHARDAKTELGVTTAEYLALYQKYGSDMMSGSVYEKVRQAAEIGVKPEAYIVLRKRLDADGNGHVSQDEARAVLDTMKLTQEQKRDMWQVINQGWKTNPYE